MPLAFVCANDHAWLAEPWELGRADCFPETCIACGAAVRLEEQEESEGPRATVFPEGYKILASLQGSTMAEMYKARHRPSGRVAALKLSLGDPEVTAYSRAATRREARLLGMLDHPTGWGHCFTRHSPGGCRFTGSASMSGCGGVASRFRLSRNCSQRFPARSIESVCAASSPSPIVVFARQMSSLWRCGERLAVGEMDDLGRPDAVRCAA